MNSRPSGVNARLHGICRPVASVWTPKRVPSAAVNVATGRPPGWRRRRRLAVVAGIVAVRPAASQQHPQQQHGGAVRGHSTNGHGPSYAREPPPGRICSMHEDEPGPRERDSGVRDGRPAGVGVHRTGRQDPRAVGDGGRGVSRARRTDSRGGHRRSLRLESPGAADRHVRPPPERLAALEDAIGVGGRPDPQGRARRGVDRSGEGAEMGPRTASRSRSSRRARIASRCSGSA